MDIEFSEDLSRVQQMRVVKNSGLSVSLALYTRRISLACWAGRSTRATLKTILFYVESDERQVEQERNPVPVDEEEQGQEAVNGGFGNDVRVQTVAKVDRVNVITVIRRC